MKEVHDSAQAQSHAEANMQGVIDAFGAEYMLDNNIAPLMFLDLEPESLTSNYVMDQRYYEVWSAAMVAGVRVGAGTIKFRPAVYLNVGDSQQSWLNLNAACAGGAVCEGVSVARYLKNKYSNPPAYDSLTWNDERLTPNPNPIPPGHADAGIPVLVWQYHGDYLSVKLPNGKTRSGDIDFEMVNPAHEGIVLSGVVPSPPGDKRDLAGPRIAFRTIREESGFRGALHGDRAAPPTIPTTDAATTETGRANLMELGAQLGLTSAMTELLDFAFTASPELARELRYWVIIDFSSASSEPRFHICDLAKSSVESLLVAHGSGSACKDDRGRACSFGNIPGSYKSSLGIYRCGDKYLEGDHLRMTVHGLQKGVNDKAFSRLIRIHSSWYVSDQHVKKFGRCGCSEGCFVLDEKLVDRVVEELSEGSFMVAVKDHA